MRTFETILWCLLVVAALSVPQVDAFARYEHHGHGAGKFAIQDISRRDIPEPGGHKPSGVSGDENMEEHVSKVSLGSSGRGEHGFSAALEKEKHSEPEVVMPSHEESLVR
jgi:hypothetical protein